MTETGVDLPGSGSVAETYRHVAKLITPGEDLALPGGYFKWYDIRVPEAGMPAVPVAWPGSRHLLRVGAGSCVA